MILKNLKSKETSEIEELRAGAVKSMKSSKIKLKEKPLALIKSSVDNMISEVNSMISNHDLFKVK